MWLVVLSCLFVFLGIAGLFTSKSTSTTPAPIRTLSSSPSSYRKAGPTALCRDGSYSYSASRRGTCSHHGGVSVWNPDVKSDPPVAAPPPAR